MTVFGAVALLLATIGLFGAVGQSVSQRQREMALRVAFGAARGGSRTRPGKRSSRRAGGGISGGGGAILGGRLLGSVFFETSPSEPGAILLALAISMTTVVLAWSLPAEHTTRLDPKPTVHQD